MHSSNSALSRSMAESAEPRQIASPQEAVDALRLGGVTFHVLSATRGDESPENAQGSGQLEFQTAVRVREQGVDYRCKVTIDSPIANVCVDAAISYESDSDVTIAPEAVEGFGDGVAIMALYPYLRQATADLGQRFGYDLTLPMLPRGELTFGRPPEADVVSQGDG